MNLKDILNKASEIGEMPKVKSNIHIRHSDTLEGVITCIRTFGIAVRFSDKNYDDWFWFEKKDDKRSKYTDYLNFL